MFPRCGDCWRAAAVLTALWCGAVTAQAPGAVALEAIGGGPEASAEDDAWIKAIGERQLADSARLEQEFGFLAVPPRTAETDALAADAVKRQAFGESLEILRDAEMIDANVANGAGDAKPGDPRELRVFVSLGMPEHTLKQLFAQGAGNPRIVFLLRGWQPPDLQGLFARIAQLLPEKSAQPLVQIDPAAFRQFDIATVPSFVMQDPQGQYLVLEGETSIAGARARLKQDPPELRAGSSWAIEEPDILMIIAERTAQMDWQAALASAKERAMEQEFGVELETATESESYLVDISVTLNEEITHEGQMIAAKGTVVNPLANYELRHRYVFFDPNSRTQLKIVDGWLRAFKNVRLFATRISVMGEERIRVSRELGHPVYPVNELLVERFGVEKVPAIVTQEGAYLRVETVGIDNAGAMLAQKAITGESNERQ